MKIQSILYISTGYHLYKKKIDGQINAFIDKGITVFLCAFNFDKGEYQCIEKKRSSEDNVKISQHADRTNKGYEKFVSDVLDKESVDAIYIRRPGISIVYYGKLFKKCIEKGIKIVYEIPTYPMDSPNGLKSKLAYVVESNYVGKKVVPRAACVPVFVREKDAKLLPNMMRAINCVDAKLFKEIAETDRQAHDSFNMLAIAFVQQWHGYDRLIKSIEQYNGKDKIRLTIYGNYTDESKRLIEYCRERELLNVSFIQEHDVKDMKEFIKQFDIGVGCLGLHRRSLEKPEMVLDTSIKNKEYCAMGLPFVHSAEDEAFDTSFKYHMLVPGDETIIKFDEIIEWHDKLDMRNENREQMWQYADGNLGFDRFATNVLNRLTL